MMDRVEHRLVRNVFLALYFLHWILMDRCKHLGAVLMLLSAPISMRPSFAIRELIVVPQLGRLAIPALRWDLPGISKRQTSSQLCLCEPSKISLFLFAFSHYTIPPSKVRLSKSKATYWVPAQ